MAWGSPPARPDAAAEGDARGGGGGKQKLAVPPPCPRCELTKGQMNRTIQNYQKAYRKKVEGLKQELGTVRADNSHLRSQVRRLRRKRLLHAPSMLVGAGLAALAARLHKLWQQRQEQQQQGSEPKQQQEHEEQNGEAAVAANGAGSSSSS